LRNNGKDADHYEKIAHGYIEDVLAGRITACRWVKLACQRHLDDLKNGHERGLVFDRERATRAVKFFSYLKLWKGKEYKGKPFVLAPHFVFITWCLMGWYRVDKTRRFRKSYIEMARKGAKSTYAGGLGAFFFVADGEYGAEVYTAAVKRDQAKIVWDNIRNLTRSSGFSDRITYLTNNLSIDATHCKCEALASDSKSLDGLDTHFASLDELHAHPTREVHDLIDDSIGARSQPMILIITTAGFNQTGICYETREYLTQILKGTVQDDSFFGIIYTLDTKKDWPELEDRTKGGDSGKELEDDWMDEDNWIKAAPGLVGVSQSGKRYGMDEKGNPVPGYMTKLTDMRDKARIAAQVPSAQNNFLTKRLNIWTQQESRWLDLGLWDQNNIRPVGEEEFAGRACFGGIDLSAVSDMTVWTLLFPDPADKDQLHVLARVWCPEARLHDTKNKYRDQYQAWKRQSYLMTTDGDAIDYDFIRAKIVEDALKFDVDSISVDRLFQGYEFAMKLNEDLGGSEKAPKVYPCGMGHMSMAGPCLEMERLLLERKLNHGGNPVLRWMADCVAVKRDPAGNMKPDKANSGGKIDGIVGILLCLDRKLKKWQPMDDVGVKVIE